MAIINLLPIFMQSFNYQNILYQWENIGLFDFILPFLLIFAVIFGILSYTNVLGANKGIHALIAIVIGLLAVRFPIYTDFLNIISPKLAIGVSLLLFLIILIGLFVPEGSAKILGWILMSVGFVIFLIIITQTYDILSPAYGESVLTSDYLIGYILLIAILIGIIVAVVTGGQKRDTTTKVADALKSLWPGG